MASYAICVAQTAATRASATSAGTLMEIGISASRTMVVIGRPWPSR